MNAKVFKNLIKEAVREAVREEIGILLLEQKKQELNENKTFSFTSDDIPINKEVKSSLRAKMGEAFGFQQPTNKLEIINAVDKNTGEKINPFAAFIADSAANMTAQDLSGLRNLG